MASATVMQLNQARNLCLADPNILYPKVVPNLQPVIGPGAELELRRWGAEFLAETFASPVLAGEHKQRLSLHVLDTLKGYLENPSEDASVNKAAIQAAASIYPYVFRHIISNPQDAELWQKMAGIKSGVLRRMDSAPSGVRICCIKFVQRVVQVQTPGLIADPRRPDQNEISLALVPRDHAVIPPSNLEAEASGLLDRLLGVIQEDSSDALIVTATLNSLGSLIRSRPSIANKIISNVVRFNPFVLSEKTPSATEKVLIKSMARTTMSLLMNIHKKNPNHPLAGSIQQNIERIRRGLVYAFDEASRKRAAPTEPTDGLSDAKRQRLDAQVPAPLSQQHQTAYPPLPPGPATFAQLFTLTDDQGAKNFDVKVIPIDLVMRLVPPLLASIEAAKLASAINAVRSRYLSLSTPRPPDASSASRLAVGVDPAVADEDDDYEPDFPAETTEQVLNDMDQGGYDDTVPLQTAEIALGPFNLPAPPPMSPEETVEHSKGAVTRVFGTLSALDQVAPQRTEKQGFNRLAASSQNRDAWITMISRLATRASAGLDSDGVKSEYENVHAISKSSFSASDAIREALFRYVIDDFRRRIDVAIAWLSEEWYNDRIQSKQGETDGQTGHVPQYEKWMHRLLDGFLPFLDAKDKMLIRFLSEIPALDQWVLQRVTRLAADPERVTLAVTALHYLILLRPPVRDMCVDALEDLYRNYDDAKTSAGKLLVKWRPGAMEQAQTNGSTPAVKVE